MENRRESQAEGFSDYSERDSEVLLIVNSLNIDTQLLKKVTQFEYSS